MWSLASPTSTKPGECHSMSATCAPKRTGLMVLPDCPAAQATGRKLLRQPTHSKHGRRGHRSGFRSSLGALGSLWRDRQEDRDGHHQQEALEYPAEGAALGTVTSSHGDNYIILSPVNTGPQVSPGPDWNHNLNLDPEPRPDQEPVPGPRTDCCL